MSGSQIGNTILGTNSGDHFGGAVAFSGDGSVIAIGAEYANYVRVYKNISSTWTQIGSDLTGSTNDSFGVSVSLSSDGSILAIGAKSGLKDNNARKGYVQIYQNNAGSWTQIGELIGRGSGFGNSVSLSSDGATLAVGEWISNANNNNGVARIYQYAGGTWSQIGSTLSGNNGDYFGSAVALSGNGSILAVGAKYGAVNNSTQPGYVKIYQNNAGSWAQMGSTLVGTAHQDFFGDRLAFSRDGSTLVVGAWNGNRGDGYVRVFRNNNGTWSQLGNTMAGVNIGEHMGTGVSLSQDGNTLAVGSASGGGASYPGSASIYVYGGTWNQIGSTKTGTQSNDQFGSSVALNDSGNMVAFGASGYGTNGIAGYVKVFDTGTDGLPRSFTATSADSAISVSWQDPTNSSVGIDYYILTNTTTNETHNITYGSYSSGTTYSYNFTGLTNGTTYTFTVVGHNVAGNKDGPTATVTDYPAKAPSAPAKPSVSAGDTQVTVSWSAPDNGGSAITGYKIIYTNVGTGGTTTVTYNDTATTQTVTGLTNGVAYTFKVAAFSAKYPSGVNYSSDSDSVTPYGPLTAPTSFTATKGNAQVVLTWYDPSPSNNYLVIDYYTVTNVTTNVSATVNFAAGGGQYSYTFTGLTNGTAYSFTVKAHSSTVTPAVFGPTASASATPSTVPSAPAKPTVVAGNTQVVVSWTAPANGGSAITGYTVTSTPGNFTSTVSGGTLTATVSGLTNGTAYTFVVYATNANGNSSNSPSSDSVTPVTTPDAPTINSATSNGTAISITWTGAGTGTPADGYAVDIAYNGTSFGRINAGTGTSYTYLIPSGAFNGYLYTAKVYGYLGTYASGVFGLPGSKNVDDISYGLNFWLDASDIGCFGYGATTTIGAKKYSQINGVVDKSSKGNNGTLYGTSGKPIYVFTSDSATLGAINSASYASIPSWTQSAGHGKPSILFRSNNNEYMSAALNARNTPMTFLAVYVNYGNYTSFGQAGDGNSLIDYQGTYRFFMVNSTGSAATYGTAPNALGYVIRSGYPNADNTAYSARINGATYDSTGKVEGFNTFLINKRDDTAYGVTYNDILISEVLIYNRALNDNEMAMAEGYLADRWGLKSWLPADHPYKSGYSGIVKTTPMFYSGSFLGFGPKDAITYYLNNTYDSYGIDQYFSTRNPTVSQALIDLRSEIKKQATSLADKQSAKGSVLNTIVSKNGGNRVIVSATDAAQLATTFDTTSGFKNQETLVIVPTFSGSSASYTLTTADWAYITDSTKNFMFDIPVSTGGTNYSLTLTHGSSSITFTYNGTVLSDGTKTYSAGDTFTLDGQTVKLTGLGSGSMNNNGGGGGGVGDPYIRTVSGISYKLPTINGAIRMYQGQVDGKILTVNATLKTQSSHDLLNQTFATALALRQSLGRKRADAVLTRLLAKEETLCFFEKIWISHGGRAVTLDVWEGRLRVLDHAGQFNLRVRRDGERVLALTGVYEGRTGTTLEIGITTGATVHVSVFDAPLVRSGLAVEAPEMETGNGAIVHVLSPEAMRLDSLTDTHPVRRGNMAVGRVMKESFVGATGVRVESVLTH